MKKILYLDCSSGISGDMFLGALIDCGLEMDYLSSELRKIKLKGYTIREKKAMRCGIRGVKFDVLFDRGNPAEHAERRTLKHILGLIGGSSLHENTKRRASEVFANLAEAESVVHGLCRSKVHFHEVGDVDSIIDIVGACIAVENMGIDEIHTSRIVTGSGSVKVHNSRYPNPPPAAAYLLRGFEVDFSGPAYELVTPTGAAILKSFCRSSCEAPPIRITEIGYGAGTNDIQERPNLLRAIIGEAKGVLETDMVTVIETNIDDMNPQYYGYLMDKILKAGALDVYLTNVIMKKSRPGCLVSVLTNSSNAGRIADIIFEETSTFGIRTYQTTRQRLERKITEVDTKFGKINVKVGFLEGKPHIAAAEYEDCRKIAASKDACLMDVCREAESIARKKMNLKRKQIRWKNTG